MGLDGLLRSPNRTEDLSEHGNSAISHQCAQRRLRSTGEQHCPNFGPVHLANLNPCLLNACCDIWGQCGIISDFCTAAPADTGAPGTAQPGSNGCISNCGTQIVSSAAPESFVKIGYFEAWNSQRPCLHMWVSDPRMSCLDMLWVPANSPW